jgi:RNA polymerase-binding transcription factor DksA
METELADEGNRVEAVVMETERLQTVDQATEAAAPDVEPRPPSEPSVDEVDRLLDEVEAALSRLDDGTYGTCAACGGTIDDLWLARSPTARTCEACTPPMDD